MFDLTKQVSRNDWFTRQEQQEYQHLHIKAVMGLGRGPHGKVHLEKLEQMGTIKEKEEIQE